MSTLTRRNRKKSSNRQKEKEEEEETKEIKIDTELDIEIEEEKENANELYLDEKENKSIVSSSKLGSHYTTTSTVTDISTSSSNDQHLATSSTPDLLWWNERNQPLSPVFIQSRQSLEEIKESNWNNHKREKIHKEETKEEREAFNSNQENNEEIFEHDNLSYVDISDLKYLHHSTFEYDEEEKSLSGNDISSSPFFISQWMSLLLSFLHNYPQLIDAEVYLREAYSDFSHLSQSLQLSIIFFFMGYFCLFSLSTHIIIILFSLSFIFLSSTCIKYIKSHGALSFLPPPAYKYLTSFSLLEISQMSFNSRTIFDLLTLFCFSLTNDEIKIIVHRLPDYVRRVLLQRGLIHLLPRSINQYMWRPPQPTLISQNPQFNNSIHIEEEKNEEKLEISSQSTSTISSSSASFALPIATVLPTPAPITIQTYSDVQSSFHGPPPLQISSPTSANTFCFRNDEEKMFSAPPSITSYTSLSTVDEAINSLPAAIAETSSSPSSTSSLYSVDEDDPTLNFWSLADRTVSTSASSLFRTWARQCYTALGDSIAEHLPTFLTSTESTSLVLFIPLGLSILTLHTLTANPQVRSFVRSHTPIAVETILCISALLSAWQLFEQLGINFNASHQKRRRRSLSFIEANGLLPLTLPNHTNHYYNHQTSQGEEKREIREESPASSMSMMSRSSTMDPTNTRRIIPPRRSFPFLRFIRFYIRFVWLKLKNDRSISISMIILVFWIIYLTKGRQKVWTQRIL